MNHVITRSASKRHEIPPAGSKARIVIKTTLAEELKAPVECQQTAEEQILRDKRIKICAIQLYLFDKEIPPPPPRAFNAITPPDFLLG